MELKEILSNLEDKLNFRTFRNEFGLDFQFEGEKLIVRGDWDCSLLEQYKILDEALSDKYEWEFHTSNMKSDIEWKPNVKVFNPHLDRTFHGTLSSSNNDYNLLTELEIDMLKNRDKDLVFSCYNRAPRPHRVRIVDEILNRNLEKHGLISFCCTEEERPAGWKDIVTYVQSLGISQKTLEYFSNCPHELDLKINEVEDFQCIRFDIEDIEKTFFTIVTEAFFYEKDCLLVSEKTFRFLPFHPMIIVGQPHTLKHLKDIGFKTFPKMFDESYDDIIDNDERLKFIMDEVERLCKLPQENLKQKYIESFDSIKHNTNFLKERYAINN